MIILLIALGRVPPASMLDIVYLNTAHRRGGWQAPSLAVSQVIPLYGIVPENQGPPGIRNSEVFFFSVREMRVWEITENSANCAPAI